MKEHRTDEKMHSLTTLRDLVGLYVLLMNLSYEGSALDVEELVVDPQKQRPTGQEWLVKNDRVRALLDDYDREIRILTKFYEHKIERMAGFDVRAYRKEIGEAI